MDCRTIFRVGTSSAHGRKCERTRKVTKNFFSAMFFFNVAGMLGLSCYILADTFLCHAALGTGRPGRLESGHLGLQFPQRGGPALGDQAGPAGMRFLYARGDREGGTGLSAGRFFWAFCVRQCFCWPAFLVQSSWEAFWVLKDRFENDSGLSAHHSLLFSLFPAQQHSVGICPAMTAATGWPWRP